MVCHHYCNCELSCPECVQRFWKWAENHTRGRSPKGRKTSVSFYEAAAAYLPHAPPRRQTS